MNKLAIVLIVLFLAGCARTYHVHNHIWGCNNEIHIAVKADVPKQIETNAEADISIIP